MYRPEGFPTFSDDYVPPMPETFNTIFKWGADAMLEGVKKNGHVTSEALTNAGWPSLGKTGKWYYIPEE